MMNWLYIYLVIGALILTGTMFVPGAWAMFRDRTRVQRTFIVIETICAWPVGVVWALYLTLRR
jgi:hypothetical protein